MKKINYQLRKEVHLVQQGEDFYVLSEIPLMVIKVNEVLYHLLCEMRSSGSFSCFPEKDPPLTGLLERLVQKGMLIKDEVIVTQTDPSISVIIPVKNRPQDIRECLIALTCLDYPEDKLEILVVDDGSTDATGKVIQTFNIRAIHLPQSIGASACRNLAAKEAKGDLLGFTDSDCVPHPQWLRELSPYFNEEKVGIVGGYVSNFYNRASLDRYEQVKSSLNLGPLPFRVEEGSMSNAYVPSCNLIIRRKAFFDAGGFQEDLTVGEDVDLCWRTRKLGYHLLYIPRGKIEHKHRNDLPHMLMRRYDYGTSEAILYKRHRDKRKMLYLPAAYSLFYTSICLGILFHDLILFVLGLGVLLADFFRKGLKIKRSGLQLKNVQVLLSVLRAHFSFSYHTSTYLARYYLIFLIPLSFFYPKMWGFLLFLTLFSGSIDFYIKKPRINLFSFLFFYTLDQLAYQTGVFWGCIVNENFGSYIPGILKKLGNGNKGRLRMGKTSVSNV
jgi:mycofactocin system glycosyltransferase